LADPGEAPAGGGGGAGPRGGPGSGASHRRRRGQARHPEPRSPPPRAWAVGFFEMATAGASPFDDDPCVGRVVVGEDELRERIVALGKEITADYSGRTPLLVGVLKGAFMFMSDLARAVDLPVQFDFMAVASYGSATKTSGVVRIVKDLELDLSGRDVVLVEDIVDSGLTLSYVRKNLQARGPASLEVCALLVREGLQKHDP